METNKIIETSGMADLYIRAICDIDDKYKEGDLVAALYGKPTSLIFRQQEKDIHKSVQNLLSFYDRNLDAVSITELSITEKILELFQETSENQEFFISKREGQISFNHELIIKELYKEIDESSITVIGFDRNDFSYNAETKCLYSEKFLEGQCYEIVYKIKAVGNLFSMNKINYLPYFSLEIHYTGNIDKEENDEGYKIYFFIPRVRIKNLPVFTPPSGLQLNFSVIHVEDDVIQMGVVSG